RWRRSGRALHDVGRARLAVAGVVMLAVATQLLTSSDPQAPVASVWTQWGPAALVVLQVVVAVGLIRTAGLVDRAVPARRLVAAAALLLWTATLEAIKIAATYRALHPVGADYPTSGAEIGPILDAFAWLAPVALLAADLLLLWSLAALTARVRSAETPATLRQAATAVALLRGVVIVVGALDLRRLAVHGRQAELAVVMVVFALAAVSVEVIAANACRQVAAGLDAEAAPARAPAV
ncbi:MAG: hypothetical protein KC464_34270, partial [Myxococcales bacterium]|nr:hypothetical protein [Myxococcales bacterium]